LTLGLDYLRLKKHLVIPFCLTVAIPDRLEKLILLFGIFYLAATLIARSGVACASKA